MFEKMKAVLAVMMVTSISLVNSIHAEEANGNVEEEIIKELEEVDPSDEEKIKGIMKRFEEVDNGNYRLEGVVVDNDEELLDNVKMKISKTRLSWFRQTHSDETKMVNGKFSIRAKGYSYIHVRFYKKGYYSEKRSFSVNEARGSGKVKRNTLVDKDIEIVLEKIGELPDLKEFDMNLKFQAGGDASILNFDIIKKRGKQDVENILNNIESLPNDCIYIIPEIDERGGLKTCKGRSGQVRAPKIELIMNDPEGGFFIHEPEERNFIKRERARREAPEKGYVKTIKLTHKSHQIFFYFKTKGKYGKGYLRAVRYDRNDAAVYVGVKCWLNPDGSRNVKTP